MANRSSQVMEDWTKYVTLNPPNEVKFKINDDLRSSTAVSDDPLNQKAIAKV